MKRDPRLHGLSSDHHHALVLGHRLAALAAAGQADADAARRFAVEFARHLEPHFAVEEDLLLPGLRRSGHLALVERTEADHAFLRDRARLAATGRADVIGEAAERLIAHVRFEEQELFPACEAALSDADLLEVGRRAPKTSGTGGTTR